MKSVAALHATIDVVRDEPLSAEPASDPPGELSIGSGPEWLTTHRIVSLSAALGLLWPASKSWETIVVAPLPGLATVVLTGAALVLACLIASVRSEAELERLDRWLLILGLSIFRV